MAIDFSAWGLNGLVVDVSSYQPKLKPDLLHEAGVRCVISKISQGLREDARFSQHADDCAAAGMPMAGYPWIDPILDAKPQVEFMLKLIDRIPIKAIFLDCEQWWSNWGTWTQAIQKKIEWGMVTKLAPNRISDVYQQAAESLLKQAGIPVGIYSSKGFVTSYASGMSAWLSRFPFWAANYIWSGSRTVLSWDQFKSTWLPKATWQPLLPPGVGRVIGWQFTGDRFALPGMYSDAGGTIPSSADVSIFDPTWLDLLTGQTAPQPEPIEPVVLAPAAPLQGTVLNQPYINIRSGPGLNYDDIGDLPTDSLINVLNVGGPDAWVEFEEGKWACVSRSGQKLMNISPIKN